MRVLYLVAVAMLSCFSTLEAFGQAAESAKAADVVEVLIRITATDGTPLHGKLSLPAGATKPVPVVFYLHGAGPSDYDRTIRYRGPDGQIASTRYYDYYARELGRLGLGFFRMSKRGCSADAAGKLVVDRSVFSKATPTVLVDDYALGLAALRQTSEIDARRIVLYGSSEGARLAPAVDADKDGVITEAELIRLVRPRLDAILKAVEDRNDDFLWPSLLNLTSAYLLDGWDGDPTSAFLLKLDLPIAIFHGDLDGTTRVEGVQETAAALVDAERGVCSLAPVGAECRIAS